MPVRQCRSACGLAVVEEIECMIRHETSPGPTVARQHQAGLADVKRASSRLSRLTTALFPCAARPDGWVVFLSTLLARLTAMPWLLAGSPHSDCQHTY